MPDAWRTVWNNLCLCWSVKDFDDEVMLTVCGVSAAVAALGCWGWFWDIEIFWGRVLECRGWRRCSICSCVQRWSWSRREPWHQRKWNYMTDKCGTCSNCWLLRSGRGTRRESSFWVYRVVFRARLAWMDVQQVLDRLPQQQLQEVLLLQTTAVPATREVCQVLCRPLCRIIMNSSSSLTWRNCKCTWRFCKMITWTIWRSLIWIQRCSRLLMSSSWTNWISQAAAPYNIIFRSITSIGSQTAPCTTANPTSSLFFRTSSQINFSLTSSASKSKLYCRKLSVNKSGSVFQLISHCSSNRPAPRPCYSSNLPGRDNRLQLVSRNHLQHLYYALHPLLFLPAYQLYLLCFRLRSPRFLPSSWAFWIIDQQRMKAQDPPDYYPCSSNSSDQLHWCPCMFSRNPQKQIYRWCWARYRRKASLCKPWWMRGRCYKRCWWLLVPSCRSGVILPSWACRIWPPACSWKLSSPAAVCPFRLPLLVIPRRLLRWALAAASCSSSREEFYRSLQRRRMAACSSTDHTCIVSLPCRRHTPAASSTPLELLLLVLLLQLLMFPQGSAVCSVACDVWIAWDIWCRWRIWHSTTNLESTPRSTEETSSFVSDRLILLQESSCMELQQLLHCLINNSHLLAPHVLKLLPTMICLQGKKDLHVNSPFSSLHSALGKQTNKSQGNPSALLAAEGSWAKLHAFHAP